MNENFKQLLVIALSLVFGVILALTLSPKAKASCYSEVKYPHESTESVNGRTYLQVVPDNYNSRVRGNLIIQYHGYGMNPAWMRQLSGSLEKYAGDNSVFFYPASAGPAWQVMQGGPDVQFFDAMVRKAARKFCIGKVYVTGYSNGAFFVNWLTYQRRQSITAVASVAGGGSYGTAIPAAVVHGYQDSFVSFSAGNMTREGYGRDNQCTGWVPTPPNECQRAVGCKLGEVTWCPWNGNHDWPWFASGAIWDLFKRY